MNPRIPNLALFVALVASCSGGSSSTTPPSEPPPPDLPTNREPVEVAPAGPADAVALAPEVTVDLVNTYVDPESGLVAGNSVGTASVTIQLEQVPGTSAAVTLEFSTDGGASFQPATTEEDTSALFAPITTPLASPQAEPVLTTYDITWRIAQDLGPGNFFAANEDPNFGAVDVRVTVGSAAHGPLAADPVEIDLAGFPFGSLTTSLEPHAGGAAFVFPDDRLFLAGGEGSPGVTAGTEFGVRNADASAFANFLFSPAAPLSAPRRSMAQALAPDGKLWLTGGEDAIGPRDEVDVFDPVAESFASLPPLVHARAEHAMAVLPNGRMIVIGGRGDAAGGPPAGNSYEIFDPSAGTWVAGPLAHTYAAPLVVELSDGRLLVTGPAPGAELPQAEYLTLTGDAQVSSSPAALPLAARRGATATVLTSGKVLFFGGHDLAGAASEPVAELFDPDGNKTSALDITNPLVPGYSAAGRWGHAAALTGAGRLILFGGTDGTSGPLKRVDSFLPKSQAFWAASPLPTPRTGAQVSRLHGGDLVLSGGTGPGAKPLSTTATLTSPDGPDQLPTATATQMTWNPPLALVSIDYALSDTESNPARVHIEWTTRPQEPGTWRPATTKTLFGVPFGDGYNDLETSPEGTSHTFAWDAAADNIFAEGSPQEFFVRITPIGAEEGQTVEFSQILP